MQKYERYKSLLRFSFNAFIWAVHVGIWVFFWNHDFASVILKPFGPRGTLLVFGMYGLFFYFFINLYGGYRIGYYKRENLIMSGCISIVFTNTVTYFQTCLIDRSFVQLLPFILMTVVDIAAFSLWAYIASDVYGRIFPPRKVLMVYTGKAMATDLVEKMAFRDEKYHIQELMRTDADETEITKKILSYPTIILCDVSAALRNRLIKFCFENDIRVYITPKISDILIRSAEEISLFDTPLLLNRNNGPSMEQKFLKRLMDIVFSVVLLAITLPFMLLTAIAIKLQDGGPVLFTQMRATIGNKTFCLYKFRSMIVDAEKDGKSQPAVNNDSRITPIGKFIRKTRLDELPQLWNILVGDMSIVGPRPERLEHVEKYTAQVPEFSHRLKVRAGLTGYAQVYGKYNTSAYDKLKMDLMYITGYSTILDIKIILMTLKTLFQKESTEGMSPKK